MSSRVPVPNCTAFLICKRIISDAYTGDLMIMAPITALAAPHYPIQVDLAFYAHVTDCHGVQMLQLQLRNLEGDVLSRVIMENPFVAPDPLQTVPLIMRGVFRFPAPAKYEVVLVANDRVVTSLAFHAGLAPG